MSVRAAGGKGSKRKLNQDIGADDRSKLAANWKKYRNLTKQIIQQTAGKPTRRQSKRLESW